MDNVSMKNTHLGNNLESKLVARKSEIGEMADFIKKTQTNLNVLKGTKDEELPEDWQQVEFNKKKTRGDRMDTRPSQLSENDELDKQIRLKMEENENLRLKIQEKQLTKMKSFHDENNNPNFRNPNQRTPTRAPTHEFGPGNLMPPQNMMGNNFLPTSQRHSIIGNQLFKQATGVFQQIPMQQQNKRMSNVQNIDQLFAINNIDNNKNAYDIPLTNDYKGPVEELKPIVVRAPSDLTNDNVSKRSSTIYTNNKDNTVAHPSEQTTNRPPKHQNMDHYANMVSPTNSRPNNNQNLYIMPNNLKYFESNFVFDDFIPQNLLTNRARNPDLNLHERYLNYLQSWELDNLRVLERIPVTTDLYNFKLEQFKDASSAKAEIEKLIHEQIIKELKRRYELVTRDQDRNFENAVWIDDYRRKIIGARIRKDLGPEPMVYVDIPKQSTATGYNVNANYEFRSNGQKVELNIEDQKIVRPKGYEPLEGFLIYWDYIIGIKNEPDKIDLSSSKSIRLVVSVVCEGSQIVEPFSVDPKDIEFENFKNLKSIFADKSLINNVFINPETLIIWEIQAIDIDNPSEITSLGWTQIDVFEISRDLKRGLWKCPLYELPVDPAITREKVQSLKVIYGPWIYLRIAFPWNDQFTNVESFDSNLTAGKYFVPEMHLRAAYYRPQIEIDYRQQVKIMEQQQAPEFSIKETGMMRTQKASRGDVSLINTEQTNFKRMPRGVKLTLNKIKNRIAASHLKVGIALLEGRNKVYDDNGKECIANSTIHNPLIANEIGSVSNLQVTGNSSKFNRVGSNKTNGLDIIFGEDFLFLRNLPAMFERNGLDLTMVFQVFEKPEPKEVLNVKKIGYNQSNNDNFGNMEFRLIGWTHFKLLNPEGKIRNGTFTVKLLRPPYKLPPVDTTSISPTEFDVDFTILEYEYDQKDLENLLREKTETKTLTKSPSKLPTTLAQKDVNIDNRPFIPNTKVQYTDKPFVKGYGIDFYIDAARYLPDNVTVTKIVLRFVNNRLEEMFKPSVISVLPRFSGPTYSPVFDFKHELRTDAFDSTIMAFISLVTVDKSCNECRIIGYAALNLFINRFTKLQPEAGNDPDIILYDGCYELPIIAEEPLRTKTFNIEKLMRYNKLPASGLLVRVKMAPLSDDWKRVLSIKDFPKKEWAERGLYLPRPLYSSGVYNNAFCLLKENEINLYSFRQSRDDPPLRETAAMLVFSKNINKDMSDRELFEWCDANINVDHSSKLIDPMFFAKYQVQTGLKFILDGVHNIDERIPVIGFYSINPPGRYYREKLSDQLILNPLINWESPMGQTIFFDKWYYFKNLEFHPKLHIIIEIKSVKVKDSEPYLEHYGWSILPVFHEKGYTINGHFQVPVFMGEVNMAVLDSVESSEKDVWSVIELAISEGKLKYKNKSTVFLRLLDSQKEGQLENKLDIETLQHRYLPKDKNQRLEFAYNGQVKHELEKRNKIKEHVPNNGNPLEFNKRIVDAAINKFNIKTYNFEFI